LTLPKRRALLISSSQTAPGLMTGSVVNYDQAVWGAAARSMPVPLSPMQIA
jgi:hypothetical protein